MWAEMEVRRGAYTRSTAMRAAGMVIDYSNRWYHPCEPVVYRSVSALLLGVRGQHGMRFSLLLYHPPPPPRFPILSSRGTSRLMMCLSLINKYNKDGD